MQEPTPKKPALHGAAEESRSQAEAAKDQTKSATRKPAESGRKPSRASGDTESQTRSR
jgi:hypothetical protein